VGGKPFTQKAKKGLTRAVKKEGDLEPTKKSLQGNPSHVVYKREEYLVKV